MREPITQLTIDTAPVHECNSQNASALVIETIHNRTQLCQKTCQPPRFDSAKLQVKCATIVQTYIEIDLKKMDMLPFVVRTEVKILSFKLTKQSCNVHGYLIQRGIL